LDLQQSITVVKPLVVSEALLVKIIPLCSAW